MQKTTPRVFTLGYEQRDLAEFMALLVAEDINVLLDVRENAWSHKPGFSKAALAAATQQSGIEYRHADWAGNPKWIRSVADSHEDCLGMYREYLKAMEGLTEAFVGYIGELLESGLSVCLVCYERHPGDCHRGILAELLECHGQTVEHISPHGRPRLVASA